MKLKQIKDIVEGHINELLGNHKEISEKRLAICNACPICKSTIAGPICDPEKWINKQDETSLESKVGYTKGCGCRLSAKTALHHARCIIGKW